MACYLDDAPARSGLLGYCVKLAAAVIVGCLAVVLIIDGSGLSSKTPAGAEAVAATRRPAAAPVSELVVPAGAHGHFMVEAAGNGTPITLLVDTGASAIYLRSEERRVGKESVSTCRARGSPYYEKKNTEQK